MNWFAGLKMRAVSNSPCLLQALLQYLAFPYERGQKKGLLLTPHFRGVTKLIGSISRRYPFTLSKDTEMHPSALFTQPDWQHMGCPTACPVWDSSTEGALRQRQGLLLHSCCKLPGYQPLRQTRRWGAYPSCPRSKPLQRPGTHPVFMAGLEMSAGN